MSLSNVSFTALADDELEPAPQIIDGQIAIHLDEQTQKISGLETQRFKPFEFQPEYIAYGKAISIAPLLSTLNQYLTTSAKQASAKARLASAEKTMARLRRLHKNKIVSSQKLQQIQSQWQSDNAIYNEMVNQSKLIINNSHLQWGAKITQWSTGRDSAEFDSLRSGKSTLLTINLAAAAPLLQNIETIFISPKGQRKNAFKASFISILPTVDKFSQGLQYSFITESPAIKPGANFMAWIPLQGKALTGIIIPESAVAWHLGQSFVFIKINNEQFVHKNISPPIKVANGYFITEPIDADDEIVIKGTQMLLSHEFRSQIPDEDDD